MNYDLEQIIARGENDRVEFKRSFAEEKEIIETIGAFLNHKGGNASLKDLNMDTVDWFIERLSEQRGRKITDPPFKVLEKYGAGVKRVIDEFASYGLVEPHCEEKFGGFYVLASHDKNNDIPDVEPNHTDRIFRVDAKEVSKEFQRVPKHAGRKKDSFA